MLIRRGATAVIALAAVFGMGASPALAASTAPRLPAVPSAAPGGTRTVPAGAEAQLLKDILHAWEITKGSGVTVAILATGVDPTVPGLAGKVTTGPDYAVLPHPPRTFGTLVAGLIAGSGPTALTSLAAGGIAPEARILSIRTNPDNSEAGASQFYASTNFLDIDANAIRYAVGHGAQVIYVDVSAGETPDANLQSAVSYALSKNVVIVASGAGAQSLPHAYFYPVAMPGVIGVGSVDISGAGAQFDNSFSARNDSILVSGPGNPTFEVTPGGQPLEIDGPWEAAAVVAAAAALIKSVYPHMSPTLVARAMELSARDRPAHGYDTTIGFGLVNPGGALAEAGQLATPSGAAAAGPGVQNAGASFQAGAPLPAIEAVHHSAMKLAGFPAAIVAGLACLAGALVLRRRWAARAAGA